MKHPYFLRSFVLAAFCSLPGILHAQQRAAAPISWQPEPSAARLLAASPFAGRLTAYRAVTTDKATLVATLATAPVEGARQAPLVLTLPTPDGGTARFQVVESSVMEPGLAAQFPEIKTYAGVGLDDPTATLRADITPQGFHAQVLSGRAGHSFYLDPVSAARPTSCLSYWRQDLRPANGTTNSFCAGPVAASGSQTLKRPAPLTLGGSAARPAVSLGGTLRTYRTAVAAAAEYTTFQGGTVPLAQAAIVTAINRVTGVYEKDLAVRLVLVANNSNIVYTNASTDPYTNGTPGTMINQAQTNIDAVIGSANYDIGHVFGTNSGGLAGLGVVCLNGQKARGVTGSGAPTGDAFWIDYVAHEMGHQFSGNHTFNGSTGSCSGGNRNATTAWEPGSGATIQAYAGICSPQDLQPNSDAYFHGGSIEEMTNFITSTSCATTISTGNTPPTISTVAGKSIPARTPFMLTATATDANGDPMTYCWEEMDLGAAGAPVTAATTQTANSTIPLFRSFLPVSSPTRYFPRLNELRNNTTVVGEALPTVARNMLFRCTVRDTRAVAAAGGLLVGAVNQSNTVTLEVVNTGTPFAVTAPNTAVTLAGGSSTNVTWAVAGTTASPISCANVNILLSTDGGLTFPTTVASNVPNNGSASVSVPNVATTTARIMVQAADNYFFDISNTNFTITLSGAPIISSFTPNTGSAGTVVTITGSNFTGSSSVAFNGTAATSFTVNSATQITATVGAGTTTGLISVTNGVGTGTSATTFVVPQAPVVTSFSPTSGAVGSSVTITGTGFTGVTNVGFNGTAAVTFTVNSATQITVTVPAGATTGPISVTNGLGTGTSSTNYTILAAPANDLCTAPSLPVLTCGTSVTGTTLLSTNTGDPTASCNTTTIEPASGGVFYRFTGTGGSVTMSTCNAGTNYDTKLFVYTGACGALACVTGNDDLTGTCAANGTTTTSTVTFASTAGTSYLIFVSGYNGAQGDFVLTTTCVSSTPTITSFTPTSGPIGTVVTITGTNLTGLTGVSFNGTAAATFAATNATTATATVPAGATTGTISLTPPGGCARCATRFTVSSPAPPTITSFTPTSGPIGTVVTITGTNLTGLTGVSFNGTAAVTFAATNATTATATVPTGATTGTISVTTPNGSATSAATFTVTTPPAAPANDLCTAPSLPVLTCGGSVTGTTTNSTSTGDPTATCTATIQPASGGVFYRFTGTGGSVTMTTCNAGTNYDTKLFVFTGACGALACVAGNDDQPTTCAATGNSTPSSVTFASTAGTSYLVFVSGFNGAQGNFVLTTTCPSTTPTITSFTPTSGPVGTVVTITGTNLTGLTGVSFNGTPAVTFAATNATTATATVPTGATTGTISLTTPGGSATSAASFTVTVPPANDLCTAPSLPVLTCGGSVSGTTLNSTSTGDPTATCGTTIQAASGGVFYRFTGTGGSVTMSTCAVGTNYDTKLFVFTGSCGALSCVTGNDDLTGTCAANGSNATSIVTFPSTAGTSYLVFVSGYNGAQGNFVLTTTCANAAPTNLALAPSSVAENAALNTTVGTLSSTDGNSGDTFTYTLVTGAGSADNASFNISGSTLRTSAVFDFETRNTYNIRVRTTDQGSLTFEKALVVTITDVAEGPTLTSLAPTGELPGSVVTLTGSGFTGATGVSFNGTAATSFTVVSNTQITVTVPAGATTGPMTVSSAAGAGNGVAFTVYSVFSSLTNNCQAATPISSTGTGEWQYLLVGSEVVAAFNDQGNTLGTVTANLIVTTGAPRVAAGGKEVLNRSWRLTAQNTFTGQTVRMRFFGLSSEFSAYQAANDGDGSDVNTLADLKIQQYGGANEDCDLSNNALPPAADVRILTPTNTQPANTNFFRSEAVVEDHFSEFYFLGDPGTPLPVTLTKLQATRTRTGAVELTWATATEKENAGWYVERASTGTTGTGLTAGAEFARISALVAGAGSSTTPRAYAWTDANAPASELAYRLLQLDANGQTAASAVVTVAAGSTVKVPLVLVPNPARGLVRVSGLPTGAPLTLTDALGRTVRRLAAVSNGTADLDLVGLSPGVYTVKAGAATARLVVE